MDDSKLKKILIIAGFIIVVIGLGAAIYYLFFKPPEQPIYPTYPGQPSYLPGQLPAVTNENVNRQVLPEGQAGLPSIQQVPKDAIISDKARGGYTRVNKKLERGNFTTIGQDGNLVYYDSDQGRFFRINPDGSSSLLSSQKFYAVNNVTWSHDASKAVLEYPDGSKITYDFKNNKQYTLPKEMQDFAFSSNDSQLAAKVITDNTQTNWLVTSNPDGSNIQYVERIGDQSQNVAVDFSPNNQVVATYRQNASANSQEVLFIGQQGENFKSLTAPGLGFEGKWTPDGQKMFYNVYRADNDFRPSLYFSTASGDNIGASTVGVNLQTWADKCTISSNSQSAFCAVPQNLPTGSGWYPQLANNLPDSFYKVDLNSGQVSLLAEPVGSQPFYSATSVYLSPDEKILYFQDRSGSVYSVGLP